MNFCRPHFLLFFFDGDNVFNITVQNQAQLFQCKHGNAFVVPEVIDCSGIYSVFVDECIGRNPFIFHGLPHGLVTDHFRVSSFVYNLIIGGKFVIEYTEKCIYNENEV